MEGQKMQGLMVKTIHNKPPGCEKKAAYGTNLIIHPYIPSTDSSPPERVPAQKQHSFWYCSLPKKMALSHWGGAFFRFGSVYLLEENINPTPEEA